jgi:hypothetical protein
VNRRAPVDRAQPPIAIAVRPRSWFFRADLGGDADPMLEIRAVPVFEPGAAEATATMLRVVPLRSAPARRTAILRAEGERHRRLWADLAAVGLAFGDLDEEPLRPVPMARQPRGDGADVLVAPDATPARGPVRPRGRGRERGDRAAPGVLGLDGEKPPAGDRRPPRHDEPHPRRRTGGAARRGGAGMTTPVRRDDASRVDIRPDVSRSIRSSRERRTNAGGRRAAMSADQDGMRPIGVAR